MTALVNGWPSTPQVPQMFGELVSCGMHGDSYSDPALYSQPLYTTGKVNHRFPLKSAQTSIQIAVATQAIGNPTAPLLLTLYNDNNGVLGSQIATGSIPSASISTAATVGWTPFVVFTAALPAGHYWIQVSSPASTSTSYYLAVLNYYRRWLDTSANAGYSGLPGFGNSGGSVVWVKDAVNNDLLIFPFGLTNDVSLVGTKTYILAEVSGPINTLYIWCSDMHYVFGAYTANFVLKDETTGQSLGSAPASQYYNSHGRQGLLDFQLPNTVNIIAGHTYSIQIVESGYAYAVILRGPKITPNVNLPTGQSTYWYGGFGFTDTSVYRVLDNGSFWTAGDSVGGFNGKNDMAVRFTPNFTDTLQSISVKTKSVSTNPTSVLSAPASFYPAGTPLIASLRADNGGRPATTPLASITIDSGTIPLDGWLAASGFSYQVQSGTPYWLYWTAPTSTKEYVCQRDVSPWRFYCLFSRNNGVTWGQSGQGPTELTWKAQFSQNVIGNPFDDAMPITLSASNILAQPFSLTKAGMINTAQFSPFAAFYNGVLKASVYSDDGSGTRPLLSSPITTGSFDSLFQYFYGGAPMPLNPAQLQANTKYWIVLSSNSQSKIAIVYYWTRPSDPVIPTGYEAMLSSDSGTTWVNPAPNNQVATTSFTVGVQPAGGSSAKSTTLALNVVPV